MGFPQFWGIDRFRPAFCGGRHNVSVQQVRGRSMSRVGLSMAGGKSICLNLLKEKARGSKGDEELVPKEKRR